MNIAIADNNGLKFTRDLKEHWGKIHEVKYERGASEILAQWADVYYIDTWDNNLNYLFKLYHGEHTEYPPDWDNKRKPKIIVRALDWEVWLGYCRDQRVIDWVDAVICIAPHIERRLRAEGNFGSKLHMIRPGVNLDIFTPKITETNGFQLGMVLGDMWWPKNHMAGLDIFTALYQQDPRWRLHIRGQHEGGTDYWRLMYEYYLISRGIGSAVTLYEQQDDMNAWYENIDILLHPGMKEAFCYAVGESMAKTLYVVVNDFYGSRDIWPSYSLYRTHDEAVDKIVKINEKILRYGMANISGRLFIKQQYNLETMINQFDQLL